MDFDRKYLKIIVTILVICFLIGVGLVLLGYFIAQDDLQLKTKVLSGKVSALMMVGACLIFAPVLMVFVGPALAKRISGKK